MDRTRSTFYSRKTGKGDSYSRVIDDKLKLLEMERELLSKEISQMQRSYTERAENDDLRDSSLIRKILDRKEELKLNDLEKECYKENQRRKEDFEVRYCMENIRDLTKAGDFLEDELEKKRRTKAIKEAERIILQDKLGKYERIRNNMAQEEKIIAERKDALVSELTEMDLKLTAKEKRGTEIDVERDLLETNKRTLVGEVSVLEEQLINKKRNLSSVIDNLLKIEKEAKINSYEKENCRAIKQKNLDVIDIYSDKLKRLKDIKVTTNVDIDKYKSELDNYNAEQTKLDVDKEHR